MKILFALGLLSAFTLPLSALAQVPQLINYQGRLLSGTNLVNGNVGLSLRLYNVPGGGTAQYEDSNTVAVAEGLYSTFIGDQTNSGDFANALTNEAVWVEVAVNGVELSPRERMASVPYALNVNADGIAGTIAEANLSANVARLNGSSQTFTGPVNFSSMANVFAGSFSGNGVGVTNVSLDSVTVPVDQPNVLAWGRNINGQTNVPASATGVVAVAGGGYHSLALRGDGTVLAWGNNGNGQTNVPASATGVVAIAGGLNHSLALRGDGRVLAWGNNGNGQTNVPASATGVVAIAGGGDHSLALRGDGTVVAWGYGGFGLTNVPAEATGVVAIAAGVFHSLVLRGDGTVLAWGAGTTTNGFPNYGQSIVPASATGVVAIAAGYYHNLALRSDGTVVAWGDYGYGQTTVPASATGVVAIAGGDYHSLALRGDGTVVAWGDNSYGQTNVPASATGVVAIASGGYHSLALRSARAPAPLARLDAVNNTFAGTLVLPSNGLTVGTSQLVVTNGRVGINTTNTSLAVLTVGGEVNANVGLFGSTHPVSIQQSYPVVGFNSYYSGSGGINKIHTGGVGGGGGTNYAGLVALDPYSGRMFFETSSGSASSHVDITRFERMTILQNGNVGIGTATPAAALHVNGDAYLSGTATASAFSGSGAGLTGISGAGIAAGTISNVNMSSEVQANISARADSNLVWGALASEQAARIGADASLSNQVAGRLASNVWAVANATTNFTRRTGDSMSGALSLPEGGLAVGTSQLVVATGGGIGFNTTNTSLARLTVNAATLGNVGLFGDTLPISLQQSYPMIGFNSYYSGSGGINRLHTGGGGTNYSGLIGLDPYSGRLLFETSSGSTNSHVNITRFERMTILQNGHVGLGTATPDAALDIEGSSPNLRIGNTAETESGLEFVDTGGTNTQFARVLFDAADVTNQHLNVYVNSTNALATFKGNQRVGIGTTNPLAELDVNGAIRTAAGMAFKILYGTASNNVAFTATTGQLAYNTLNFVPFGHNFSAPPTVLITGLSDLGSSNTYDVVYSLKSVATNGFVPRAFFSTTNSLSGPLRFNWMAIGL